MWSANGQLGDLILRMGSTSPTRALHQPLWDPPPSPPLQHKHEESIELGAADSLLASSYQHTRRAEGEEDETDEEEGETQGQIDQPRSTQREASPTDTETSDAFFDANDTAASPDRQAHLVRERHPYGVILPEAATSAAHLQQFSAASSSSFFHPDAFPLPQHYAAGSSSTVHTPATLQLYHSPSEDVERSAGLDETDLPTEATEGSWNMNHEGEEGDAGGRGRDQAGVILG